MALRYILAADGERERQLQQREREAAEAMDRAEELRKRLLEDKMGALVQAELERQRQDVERKSAINTD
jgi:hypothetical protein